MSKSTHQSVYPPLVVMYATYIAQATRKFGLTPEEAAERLPRLDLLSKNAQAVIAGLVAGLTKAALLAAFARGIPEECIESKVRQRGGGYRNHREVYIKFFGPESLIGLEADHLCENKGCINPAHMVRSTTRENTLRRVTNGNTHKTSCLRGHAYTPSNTYLRNGNRQCRECRRINDSARRQRQANGTLSVPFAKRTKCVRGHAYTTANTYRQPETGYRSCRICNAVRRSEHARRTRQP